MAQYRSRMDRVKQATDALRSKQLMRRAVSEDLSDALRALETRLSAQSEQRVHYEARREPLARANVELAAMVERLLSVLEGPLGHAGEEAFYEAAAIAAEILADEEEGDQPMLEQSMLFEDVSAEELAREALGEAEDRGRSHVTDMESGMHALLRQVDSMAALLDGGPAPSGATASGDHDESVPQAASAV